MNPIHPFDSYFRKIHPNITLPIARIVLNSGYMTYLNLQDTVEHRYIAPRNTAESDIPRALSCIPHYLKIHLPKIRGV